MQNQPRIEGKNLLDFRWPGWYFLVFERFASRGIILGNGEMADK